jgi:hypothetical protein
VSSGIALAVAVALSPKFAVTNPDKACTDKSVAPSFIVMVPVAKSADQSSALDSVAAALLFAMLINP